MSGQQQKSQKISSSDLECAATRLAHIIINICPWAKWPRCMCAVTLKGLHSQVEPDAARFTVFDKSQLEGSDQSKD